MIPMTMNEELLARFLATNEAERITLACVGSGIAVVTDDELEPHERQIVAQYKANSEPPIISHGKPTVVRVVAWMLHGDVVNENGFGFVREELNTIAAQVSDTSPLVMDLNHSAARDNGLPKMIGAWTKAEVAFDKAANGGKGAWGVLASGVMMAWLFPEIATTLLAEQARLGHIRFSMQCIPGTLEFVPGSANEPGYQIVHNPVMFALSALDVPNADPDANGLAAEGSNDPNLEQEFRQQLTAAALVEDKPMSVAIDPAIQQQLEALRARLIELLRAHTPADSEPPGAIQPTPQGFTAAAPTPEENSMTPEQIAELQSQLAAAVERLEALSAVEAQVTALQTTLDEMTTAREAAQTELATANTEIERLTTELAAATDELTSYRAADAERQQSELIATRLASLPESYRAAHAKKSDEARARIEEKWAAMSDEEFEFYKSEELLAGFATASTRRAGYVGRSEREGALPTVTAGSLTERLAKHIK